MLQLNHTTAIIQMKYNSTIITASIRSLRQSNVFTLCVCPWGGGGGGLVWCQEVQCQVRGDGKGGGRCSLVPGPRGVLNRWGNPPPKFFFSFLAKFFFGGGGARGGPSRGGPPSDGPWRRGAREVRLLRSRRRTFLYL